MTKHTPAPWTLEHGTTQLENIWDSQGQFKIASFIYSANGYDETANANARLIAAAPELLEALELLQMAIRSEGLLNATKRFSLCVADANARAAIAKAKGE